MSESLETSGSSKSIFCRRLLSPDEFSVLQASVTALSVLQNTLHQPETSVMTYFYGNCR